MASIGPINIGQLVAVHAAVLKALKYFAVIVFTVMVGGLIIVQVDRLQAPRSIVHGRVLSGIYRWITGHNWKSKGDSIVY